MPDTPPLIALDIEADTTVNGLDPRVAAVTEVSLSTSVGSKLFSGPEATLLSELETYLAAQPPSLLVTWNGHAYDMPFLADRFARLFLATTLTVTPDPTIPIKYSPLPGHTSAYRAHWGIHRHVDICHIYRPIAQALAVPFNLKPVARAVLGIEPIQEDRTTLHLLSPARRARYATSDTEITLALAVRELDQLADLAD
jgi:DNA polymerase elongation subunit (family B)